MSLWNLMSFCPPFYQGILTEQQNVQNEHKDGAL